MRLQNCGDETIGPTAERLRHAHDDDGHVLGHEIEVGDKNNNWRAFRLTDAPLGRLRFRREPKITSEQFAAGEIYYGVVYYAGMMPSGAIDPTVIRVDGGGNTFMPDRLVAAKARYNRILRGMVHAHHHIVSSIVVEEIKLGDYAERFVEFRERRTRQAVALDRLICGLDWLACHFGIVAPKRGIVAEQQSKPEVLTRHGEVVQRLPIKRVPLAT
jgi:hypothetical protein